MTNVAKERPLRVIAGSDDKPLIIGDLHIPCYVLEDETRIVGMREMTDGLGLYRGGRQYSDHTDVALPPFVRQIWLNPSIDPELQEALNSPIRFQTPKGNLAQGYPATILVKLCHAIMTADQAGRTTPRQQNIVRQATAIIMAAAQTTIDILIDETTGYDQETVITAAQRLRQYLALELQPYVRTFPLEFYRHIFRLNGWDESNLAERPAVVGRMTNELIYDRITPGLREALERLNPTLPTGRRKFHHHRHLTREEGRIELQKHISSIVTLMRISKSWEHLKELVAIAHPKPKEQLPLWVFDDIVGEQAADDVENGGAQS